MSYTVLARRYRSETFDDVVGQEAISTTLKNAITFDRVAHAYLFTGTRGVGKTTMARILAKALNCLASEEATITPCNKCEGCLAIGEGNDIDVVEIDAASNTGVEHIRQLRQNAVYRPARARFKIYIIDEVHMLSTSAFNALLKTLEEPPEHVKFILATTESNKILPTILSRCQRFDFRNIQIDDIAKQIRFVLKGEDKKADDAVIRRIARLANGSMRDALSLLDQLLSMTADTLQLELLNNLLGTPRLDITLDMADAIAEGNISNVLLQIDQAVGQGLTLDRLVQSLQDHFRDLMVLKNCGAKTELVDVDEPELRERMGEQVQRFDDASLVYNITVLEELRQALKTAGAAQALVEATLVRMAAHEQFSDTAQVIEQLQQLQGGRGGGTATSAPAQKKTFMPAPRPAQAVTHSENKPAPQTAPAPAKAKTGFTAPATLDLPWFESNWQKLTDQCDTRAIKMHLKDGRPVSWQNDTLTVEYQPQNGFVYKQMSAPDRLKKVEEVISVILARTVKFHFNLNESATSEDKKKPLQRTAGAKPSQDQILDARTDAKVMQVIEILGGDIKQVQPVKS